MLEDIHEMDRRNAVAPIAQLLGTTDTGLLCRGIILLAKLFHRELATKNLKSKTVLTDPYSQSGR